jgi:hypothetical protein
MQYSFPETRFVAENTSVKQRAHVMSEAFEAQDAINHGETEERIDEEFMDLVQALTTYFKCREREKGSDYVQGVWDFVYSKTARRGNYTRKETLEILDEIEILTQKKAAHLRRFVDEVFDIHPDLKVSASDIYAEYLEWEDRQPLNLRRSQRHLGKYLTSRFTKTRTAGGYIYHGIGIKG